MSILYFTQNCNKLFPLIQCLKTSNYNKMQRNAAVLTVVCILLCLSFNYTFPLHRELAPQLRSFSNNSAHCALPSRGNIVDRTKKMASNIENALKKIKDSTQDFGKNIYDNVNLRLRSGDKGSLSEEDIRQYEQLVIMKKYPYLDLKDLELKYSPSSKNARQSIKFEPDNNLGNDPSICEPLEEGPNVEITNRGLSGFAIPPQLSRRVGMVENKLKLNNLNSDGKQDEVKVLKKSTEQHVLGSLRSDVREFVDKKLHA